MNANKEPSLNMFQIAAAYIGTVVGAGFASGQEILRFFIAHGVWGIAGITIASLFFFFIGYSILLLGKNTQAASHVEIVRHTNGKLLGSVIDVIITVFLFGGLSTMIAGSGALFREQFAIPSFWGTLIMAVITLLTVITGTKGVINAISFVVPFLIVAVVSISVVSLIRHPLTEDVLRSAARLDGATPHWLLSAVTYASYNIVVSIAVLTPMGVQTQNKGRLFWGALLGSAGLQIGMFAIYFGVLGNLKTVGVLELPMIGIAQQLSSVVRILFAVVLIAEVYTTAVGNLYGFVQRISAKIPKLYVLIGVTMLALLAGQLGFSNLVRHLYPAVGYGGMLFFVGVFYTWISKRDSLR